MENEDKRELVEVVIKKNSESKMNQCKMISTIKGETDTCNC